MIRRFLETEGGSSLPAQDAKERVSFIISPLVVCFGVLVFRFFGVSVFCWQPPHTKTETYVCQTYKTETARGSTEAMTDSDLSSWSIFSFPSSSDDEEEKPTYELCLGDGEIMLPDNEAFRRMCFLIYEKVKGPPPEEICLLVGKSKDMSVCGEEASEGEVETRRILEAEDDLLLYEDIVARCNMAGRESHNLAHLLSPHIMKWTSELDTASDDVYTSSSMGYARQVFKFRDRSVFLKVAEAERRSRKWPADCVVRCLLYGVKHRLSTCFVQQNMTPAIQLHDFVEWQKDEAMPFLYRSLAWEKLLDVCHESTVGITFLLTVFMMNAEEGTYECKHITFTPCHWEVSEGIIKERRIVDSCSDATQIQWKSVSVGTISFFLKGNATVAPICCPILNDTWVFMENSGVFRCESLQRRDDDFLLSYATSSRKRGIDLATMVVSEEGHNATVRTTLKRWKKSKNVIVNDPELAKSCARLGHRLPVSDQDFSSKLAGEEEMFFRRLHDNSEAAETKWAEDIMYSQLGDYGVQSLKRCRDQGGACYTARLSTRTSHKCPPLGVFSFFVFTCILEGDVDSVCIVIDGFATSKQNIGKGWGNRMFREGLLGVARKVLQRHCVSSSKVMVVAECVVNPVGHRFWLDKLDETTEARCLMLQAFYLDPLVISVQAATCAVPRCRLYRV